MWYLITRFRCSHVWARERCVSSASAALSFDSACETWTTAVTALGLVLKLDSWHFYNLYLLKPALYLQLVKAPPFCFFFSQSQLTFGTNICQLCSGISALVSSTTSLPLFFFLQKMPTGQKIPEGSVVVWEGSCLCAYRCRTSGALCVCISGRCWSSKTHLLPTVPATRGHRLVFICGWPQSPEPVIENLKSRPVAPAFLLGWNKLGL